jgi:hypothetical protein
LEIEVTLKSSWFDFVPAINIHVKRRRAGVAGGSLFIRRSVHPPLRKPSDRLAREGVRGKRSQGAMMSRFQMIAR